jgi:hypothetical protein
MEQAAEQDISLHVTRCVEPRRYRDGAHSAPYAMLLVRSCAEVASRDRSSARSTMDCLIARFGYMSPLSAPARTKKAEDSDRRNGQGWPAYTIPYCTEAIKTAVA